MSAEYEKSRDVYNPWSAKEKRQLVMNHAIRIDPNDPSMQLWHNVGKIITVAYGAKFEDGKYVEGKNPDGTKVVYARDLLTEGIAVETNLHPERLADALGFMTEIGLIADRE